MSEPVPPGVSEKSGDAKRPGVAIFTSHWLAMLGLGLVLTGIIGWVCLLPARLRTGFEVPYIGVANAVAIVIVLLGVVITPIGLWFGRRRLAQRIGEAHTTRSAWLKLAVFLLIVSAFNLLVVAQGAQSAVHHLESNEFCLSCHPVHDAEERTYTEGPHAAIHCVDCHVGEGNVGFFKAKLQGTHQLLAVLTDSVPYPVRGPIERGLMVPAAQTCENCHWKQQPAAAKVKLIQRYASDATNTPETTLLTMNIGGRQMGGIHGAHNGDDIEIRFVASDAQRRRIPLVESVDTKTGVKRTYVLKGEDAASFANAPRITMQCFDCHNRPAHQFEMPEPAVDHAIATGRLPVTLPFLKKKAVEILTAEYATREAAAAEIPVALEKSYASTHPEVAKARADEIKEAGLVLADLHARNVYPALGITWGTYPDYSGHQDSPGCFRCHDGQHVAENGDAITNNCFRCHFPAAVGETKPEVLELLGVDKMMNSMQKKQ